MNKLIGLYTALVTPFRDGAVDEIGLKENLDFQVKSGVDGIVVLGTTGEAPTLSRQESELVIKTAVAHAGSKVHVMVGTGANSTAATLEQTLAAKELGADSVLIVSPYYNRPTQRGLFNHFETVALAADIPIVVYNVPSRTGINIDPLTLREIAQLPNVIGVKEASGDMNQVADIIHHIANERPDFAVLSGDDSLTLPIMALGGSGIISVMSNLTPVPMVRFVESLLNNRMDEARKLHYQLFPLFKALFFETNPIPIKEAMNLCGLPAGPCRLPLTGLSTPHRDSLKRLLADAGLLPAGATR